MIQLFRAKAPAATLENSDTFEEKSMPFESVQLSAETRKDQETKVQDLWLFITKIKQLSKHVEEVRRLSLRLFDELFAYHGCGIEERYFLECAAIIHDCGHAIAQKKHHKHSMRLIMEAKLPTFTPREKLVIANIARYHRKNTPKPTHLEFMRLTPADQETVRKMAALLRIADSLIRADGNRVNHIDISVTDEQCHFTIFSNNPCVEEIESFSKRKDLFINTFGRDALLTKKD
jgi:exopolyphosphatase/guanosine-5'-triphosphate,3'-diphosphate pyrophosphatase